MARPKISPIQARPPFTGLDTVRPPRELGPHQAVVARNVLLADNGITVRPPFEVDDRFTGFPPGRVYAGLDWNPPLLGGAPRQRVSLLHVGNTLFSNATGGHGVVQARPGTFVPANGRLYYLDGLRVHRTDGLTWSLAGIPPPTAVTNPGTISQQSITFNNPPPPAGTVWWMIAMGAFLPDAVASTRLSFATSYQFAFTWYDETTGTESNPVITDVFTTPVDNGNGQAPYLYFSWGTAPGGTSIRSYVRNVTALEPFLLLWQMFSLGAPVPRDFSQGKVGNATVGPFAPSKNGIPEYASVGLFYKRRMLYNDLRNPTLLRFSAQDAPEHVDPLDFLVADDDGGMITGMGEYSGHAVIVKERGAWMLSGDIITPTNESIALGASVVPSGHQFLKTKVVNGCCNTRGGNGAIVFGKILAWNGLDGFYGFDGINEVPLGVQIRPTWRRFVGEETLGRNQAVSYFHDLERGILFMVNLSSDESRVQILAFHYRLEGGRSGWTEIATDDASLDNPTCAVAVLGVQEPSAPPEPAGAPLELRPTGLAVAVGGVVNLGGPFRILAFNDRVSDRVLPDFLYRTGRLTIVDGIDKHYYAVKWFFNEAPGGGFERAFDFGFRTHPRDVDEFQRIDMSDGLSAYQEIAETGEDVELVVRPPGSGDPRWSPALRLFGFEIDAEVIGQR